MRFAITTLAALVVSLPVVALPAVAAKPKPIVAHLSTSTGKDAGTATFTPTKDGKVKIKLELKNIPEGDHAVHIHQNPTCEAPDFKTAGGHFNPEHKQHGTLNPLGHHAGDMPLNLSVGVEGTVDKTFTVDSLSLNPDSPNFILANGGTSIMIHAKPDDNITDPTGNAGNRIACGVITPPTQ
jgi:Cu-Zn family superoxide dismutase